VEPKDVTIPDKHLVDCMEEFALWIDGIQNVHDDLAKIGLSFPVHQFQSHYFPGGASFHLCEKLGLVQMKACGFHFSLVVGQESVVSD